MLIIYAVLCLIFAGQTQAYDDTLLKDLGVSDTAISIQTSIRLGTLPDGSEWKAPLKIIHSGIPGPVVSIFGAIHGDEIVGMEIIRRISSDTSLMIQTGTLLLLPVINLPGFYQNTRYLPDRRDLNRSFPGTAHGSQAARLAYALIQFLKTSGTTIVLDLHSAASNRHNLPQIRATYMEGDQTEKLAHAFAAPVILNSGSVIDGSLRAYCKQSGIVYLLYEGGEASRIDEASVKAGVDGVYLVLEALNMKPVKTLNSPFSTPFYSRKSTWARASHSGVLESRKLSGDVVIKNQSLGYITNLLGEKIAEILSPHDGIIIGHVTNPILDAGDPIFHIAMPTK